MLTLVKLLHTTVWLAFNACFLAAVWSGLNGRFDAWFWIPLALIAAECVMLVLNDWTCPLTRVAARYTDSRDDAFDIYLPQWVARHNKTIYTVLFVLASIAIAFANLAT